ncbi:MAG: tubulin-like doman-containing protein [Acidobacteriota bacterium]
MSYRNISPVAAGADANAAKIRPTLLIGIGGTGGNVLQRVRNWVIDQYGSFEQFPILRFLHLDTDERSSKDTNKDASKDPLYKKKEFVDNEWISLKVNIAQFLDVNNFPRLKPWFKPDQRLRNNGDLGQGAGQVRVASRLGFFHHYGTNKIRPKLDLMLRQLRSIDLNQLTHPELKNLQLYTNTINVYVICSSAGGTGSGAFLDMGALLHTIQGIETHLILVLPEVFKQQDPRCVANGYAGLVELNHYQYGNNFNIYFEQEPTAVPPPLYQHTYLIDGRSASGSTTDDVGLYTMIANSFIQDFKSGQFSDDKRSFRSNMAQYTQRLAVYEHLARYNNRPLLVETFPCRYSSFAVSRIYYPREQIVKSCAYRLGATIMNYWLGGSDRANVTDQALSFLKDCKLTYEDLRRYLEVKDQASLDQICRVKVDEKVENCRDLTDGWSREFKHFNDVFYHDHLRIDDPKDAARWGDFVRHIRETCYEHTMQLAREELLKHLKERLSHPSYGFDYVIQILGALPVVLRGSHYRERAATTMAAEEKRLQPAQRQYQDAIRELQELERWSTLQRIAGGWKQAVDVQVESWREGSYTYLRSLGYKYVYETYMQLVDAIASYIEKELRLELITVNSIIVEKQQEFLKLAEYYKNKDESAKMDLRLYHPDEIERYYRQVVIEDDAPAAPATRPPARVADYAGLLLSHLQSLGLIEKPTVSALTERIQGEVGSNRVINKIIEFLEREVSERVKEHVLDKLFPTNYNETTVRKQVEDTFNLAKGWVHTNDTVPPELQVPQGGHKMLIGIDAAHPHQGKFAAMVGSFNSGSMSVNFKPIGNSHEIVFYGEMAGLSLAAVSSLPEMRRVFREKERDPSEIDLFTTKNRFMMRDIMYRDDEGRNRYLRSVRGFVLGVAGGVIKQDENKDQNEPRNRTYTVIRYDERDLHKIKPMPIGLGMYERAVTTLYEELSAMPLREKILKDVERFKGQLADTSLPEENDQYRGHLMLWYALLDALVNGETQPFPEIEVELPGGARDKMISPERECLLEELYEVSLMIPAVGNRDRLAQSLRLLQQPRVMALFTESWHDELRDSRQGAIPFVAFSEARWQENKVFLGDIIRGKDPTLEAQRIFSLALIYGKLTTSANSDMSSHRNLIYGFERAVDLMETRFQQEELGSYEESIERLSKSVQLRQHLEAMVKRAEEELFRLAGGRGLLLGWLLIEDFLEHNRNGDQDVYREKIDNLQRRLRSSFPGRREELLRVREALLVALGQYCQEHHDESDRDGCVQLHCRILDWRRIESARTQLENLLQTGQGMAAPSLVTVPIKTNTTPVKPSPAVVATEPPVPLPIADNGALERFRARVQLMLKAGKGKLGAAQRKVLDKEQRELGLSVEETERIINELMGGDNAKQRHDYAVFFLSLYHDGSTDLTALQSELAAEQARLQISASEAAEIEKAVVDYFDYYRALVTGPQVEDWARSELKLKQAELKLADEIMITIEEHIRSL